MEANAPNAILAISSTDRYTSYIGGNANQPISNALFAQYFKNGSNSNDFSITAPNALINGYIEKIIISQIQLQYYLPTIIPSKNDFLVFRAEQSNGSGIFNTYSTSIPYGFQSPSELATVLQIFMNEIYVGDNFVVTYSLSGNPPLGYVGFEILFYDGGKRFYFPSPIEMSALGFSDLQILNTLKLYRVFGITSNNTNASRTQVSTTAPNFLYTPFIDIYSDALTNYQSLKDTDSSTSRRKGLISRIYLSGVGTAPIPKDPSAQFTSNNDNVLGSYPFTLTYDLNTPKVVKWTRDSAVNSLDFQMRDCYGDLLFNSTGAASNEVFNTEFQMTLLCIEGD